MRRRAQYECFFLAVRRTRSSQAKLHVVLVNCQTRLEVKLLSLSKLLLFALSQLPEQSNQDQPRACALSKGEFMAQLPPKDAEVVEKLGSLDALQKHLSRSVQRIINCWPEDSVQAAFTESSTETLTTAAQEVRATVDNILGCVGRLLKKANTELPF
jgi:hypothetical protein